VEAALSDFETLIGALAGDAIDEAVFDGKPSRPPSLEVPAERLGLSKACEWLPLAFSDKRVQPFEDVTVSDLPVEVVFPCAGMEDDPHGSIRS
jgi:hypothetical protein